MSTSIHENESLKIKRQPYKPGSVNTVFAVISIIYLGYTSQYTSIDLPFWLIRR